MKVNFLENIPAQLKIGLDRIQGRSHTIEKSSSLNCHAAARARLLDVRQGMSAITLLNTAASSEKYDDE
jgi:hypothetical protein